MNDIIKNNQMSSADLRALIRAKHHLEKPGLLVRPVIWLGDKAGSLLVALPKPVAKMVNGLSKWALRRALGLALTTLNVGSQRKPKSRLHKFATMVTGACGGILGWITLVIELPITTVIMLRGIAEIARNEGEDLTLPEARLACLSVFALDNSVQKAGESSWQFFSSRAAIQKLVVDAAQVAGTKGAASHSAPAVLRLLQSIAGRFGVTISEKMMVQALPLVGIIGGITINSLLCEHYFKLAKAFFTLRRLEREYGNSQVEHQFRTAAL